MSPKPRRETSEGTQRSKARSSLLRLKNRLKDLSWGREAWVQQATLGPQGAEALRALRSPRGWTAGRLPPRPGPGEEQPVWGTLRQTRPTGRPRAAGPAATGPCAAPASAEGHGALGAAPAAGSRLGALGAAARSGASARGAWAPAGRRCSSGRGPSRRSGPSAAVTSGSRRGGRGHPQSPGEGSALASVLRRRVRGPAAGHMTTPSVLSVLDTRKLVVVFVLTRNRWTI